MNRIAELRKKQGISQTELAKLLGIAQNTLSQYENDRRTPPNRVIMNIADLFAVSTNEVLDDPESRKTKSIKGGATMTLDNALDINQNWTYEQAANDVERYVLRGEPPAMKAAALAVVALKEKAMQPAEKTADELLYELGYRLIRTCDCGVDIYVIEDGESNRIVFTKEVGAQAYIQAMDGSWTHRSLHPLEIRAIAKLLDEMVEIKNTEYLMRGRKADVVIVDELMPKNPS